MNLIVCHYKAIMFWNLKKQKTFWFLSRWYNSCKVLSVLSRFKEIRERMYPIIIQQEHELCRGKIHLYYLIHKIKFPPLIFVKKITNHNFFSFSLEKELKIKKLQSSNPTLVNPYKLDSHSVFSIFSSSS